jgi:hypothetical protein
VGINGDNALSVKTATSAPIERKYCAARSRSVNSGERSRRSKDPRLCPHSLSAPSPPRVDEHDIVEQILNAPTSERDRMAVFSRRECNLALGCQNAIDQRFEVAVSIDGMSP